MRRFFGAAGSVSRLIIKSEVLGTNILGDPTSRAVDVYIPAGHDGRGLPLLVDLVGITSSGLSHTNWMAFGENMQERLDRLIGEGRMPPVVVAFPDCFTRIGGNQYVNSAATGPWEDFLIAEMLPAIEGRFGCGGSGRRGVFGKSSGGYGAIMNALRHSRHPGRPRHATRAIWASSCVTCQICRQLCEHWPPTIPSSNGGGPWKRPRNGRTASSPR